MIADVQEEKADAGMGGMGGGMGGMGISNIRYQISRYQISNSALEARN